MKAPFSASSSSTPGLPSAEGGPAVKSYDKCVFINANAAQVMKNEKRITNGLAGTDGPQKKGMATCGCVHMHVFVSDEGENRVLGWKKA